jgi:hypothetical protein
MQDLDAGFLDSAEEWISENLQRLRSHHPAPASSAAEPLSNNNEAPADDAQKETDAHREALLELAFGASRIRYLMLVDAQVEAAGQQQQQPRDTIAQVTAICKWYISMWYATQYSSCARPPISSTSADCVSSHSPRRWSTIVSIFDTNSF